MMRFFLFVTLVFTIFTAHSEVLEKFRGSTEAGRAAGFSTPTEKNIDQKWGDSLFAKGSRKVYQGEELYAIGMPCGGIGAGQLYVRGDGTLARWLIFGQHFSTHWGTLQNGKPQEYGFHSYRPKSELHQGFAVEVQSENGEVNRFDLSQKDFDDIRFIGEYPVAEIEYRSKSVAMPIEVDLEVFSPWTPLDPEQSGYPATVMRFSITNTSDKILETTLAGWLENGVGLESRKEQPNLGLTNTVKQAKGMTFLSSSSTPGGKLKGNRDWGTMGLGLMGEPAEVKIAQVSNDMPAEMVFTTENVNQVEAPASARLTGALGRRLTLEPKEKKEVIFIVAWYFPDYVNPDDRGKTGAVGRMYSNWASDAFGIANRLAENFDELDRTTHLFRDTYYDSTLPYWFVQRVGMPASTLATLTSQWWENGRFYQYEGVGFCAGTCTHVYVYSQAMARLFPGLERNIRERQDLAHPAQDPKSGRVNFRGRDYKLGVDIHASGYAADGQCGIVLRAYREHLTSKNGEFLKKLWPNIKLAMDYMVEQDQKDGTIDGVVWKPQHNTWDVDFHGSNTYTGALYLAALRAAEEMALLQGDEDAAKTYRGIYEMGSRLQVSQLWNGDYFTHQFPSDSLVKKSRSWGNIPVQYSDGCFSNQLFGQNYADQLGLGYLYPAPMVKKALRSIYHYNWLPDMAILYDKVGEPYKYMLAHSGDAGLLQCSWPLEPRPINAVKLVEHVWTGFEYQVASHMISEGLIEEAFAIIRGIHDRYSGTKHNPWNEIEGGDHYGRAMASWGCLTSIGGFQYDGPAGKMGFSPKFQEADFKSFYSSAESWGSFVQKRSAETQQNKIEVKWGILNLSTLELALPSGKTPSSVRMELDGKEVSFTKSLQNESLSLSFETEIEASAGSVLVVDLRW